MAKLTVMPMIGEIDYEHRLQSLRGCHAITEKRIVRGASSDTLGRAIEEAIKDLLISERAAIKASFIVEIKL